MTATTVPNLTPADIGIIRHALAALRAAGYEHLIYQVDHAPAEHVWRTPDARREVSYQTQMDLLTVTINGRKRIEAHVSSPQEAVDLLVTVGILPDRLRRVIPQRTETMTVTIRDRASEAPWGSHGPITPCVRTVTISAGCPRCGGRRGEPRWLGQCDDGAYYSVQVWDNPCGHIDYYADVVTEAELRARLEQQRDERMARRAGGEIGYLYDREDPDPVPVPNGVEGRALTGRGGAA